MQNRMHTIWLTTLTLIAMLLSSVAFANPLMPIQMAIANQTTILSDTNDALCASSQKHAVTVEQIYCDSEHMTSDHQCCPVNCIASASLIVNSKILHTPPSSLILITKEPFRYISSIANALYKPPIA